MYICVLVYLLIASTFEVTVCKNGRPRKKIPYGLYIIGLVWLTAMACFRFGQGMDYPLYLHHYIYDDPHSEPLYVLLGKFFKSCGFSFETFVFVVSLFCMFCTHKAIMRYSPYRCVSLLLLYPTIYLSYYLGLIRQGIVIALFLGIMLQWIIDGEWKKYCVFCVLVAFVHSIAWLLLPLYLVRFLKERDLFVCMAISVPIGLLFILLPRSFLSFVDVGAFVYYLGDPSISWLGMLEKIVLLIIIITMWHSSRDEEKDVRSVILYKIFLTGVSLAFVVMGWGQLASRFSEIFRTVYIVLLPMLLITSKRYIYVVMLFILCYATVISCKNISAYVEGGGYVNHNFLTYPYVSIFDKEKIFERGNGYYIYDLDASQ